MNAPRPNKPQPSGIVTLLTDFGSQDWYVGVMKGVIVSRCETCRLVDLTHDITPGDVFAGAFVLRRAYSFFPRGTVHLAVVDPGVGGERRPIMVETAEQWFVGPDNGLFSGVLQEVAGGVVRRLRNKALFLQPISGTFHGRDLFAPAAAYIAAGGTPEELGPAVEDWVSLGFPEARIERDAVLGLVLYVDRFGNGITNIEDTVIRRCFGGNPLEIIVQDHRLKGIRRSYVDVPKGQPLALIGSSGFLEISVNRGNARRLLNLRAGETQVRVVRYTRGLS
jgi:S-adenosylmethionine hydrolase